MKDLHLNIRNLLEQGWRKKKSNDYHIFLKKDNVERKVSLNSGETIAEKNIEQKVTTESSL